MNKRHIGLTVLAAASLLPGCRNDGSNASGKQELVLYCGAGIRPPVAELAEAFGKEHGMQVVTDYAGSETLLAKIKLVEKGDLYMPGDRHYVEQAAEAGMVLSQRSVCYFVPTILVKKANPKNIAGLSDLLRADVKLGLGDDRACAIGRKSKAIFERANVPWSQVEAHLSFRSLTVNELAVQVQTGRLDAAIVWGAVANYYTDETEAIAIPADQNVISTVDVAVLKFSEHAELAEQFAAFAASEQGRAVFARHNYQVDPPSQAGQ